MEEASPQRFVARHLLLHLAAGASFDDHGAANSGTGTRVAPLCALMLPAWQQLLTRLSACWGRFIAPQVGIHRLQQVSAASLEL